MNIRPFRPEDEAAVVVLWRSCDLLRPWNDPHKDIALCRDSGHGELLVGEADRELVASVMVGHDGHRGWLYYLAVAPESRRQGFGRELVEAAERWLTDRDVPKAELMIRRENTAATEFYRRIGYRQESRTVMGRRLDGVPQPVEHNPAEIRRLPLIDTTITYLEMSAPPDTPPIPAPAMKLALLRVEKPSTGFYLYLYDAVGREWTWVNRKHMPEEELGAIIRDELVEIYVLYVGGVPAGYAELDRRKEPDVELAYFGLVPEFIGRGLGRYFLDWAIRQAWSSGPARVWVNTCTEDHPRALPLYQRLGFRVFARETATLDPNV